MTPLAASILALLVSLLFAGLAVHMDRVAGDLIHGPDVGLVASIVAVLALLAAVALWCVIAWAAVGVLL